MYNTKSNHGLHLVSGTSSGLGAFLKKELYPCSIYNRFKKNSYSGISVFDNIIHVACGLPFGKNINEDDYINSQVVLCKTLASIKHKRFVYISSIDVNQQKRTVYGEMKYQIEQFIINNVNSYLIIRPGSLIGKGMKQNTLTRIFSEQRAKISLNKNSYYYISFYEDILKLIASNSYGIWTVCSNQPINIDALSKYAGSEPEWGNFTYSPTISDSESQYYHNNNDSVFETYSRIEQFFANYKIRE